MEENARAPMVHLVLFDSLIGPLIGPLFGSLHHQYIPVHHDGANDALRLADD